MTTELPFASWADTARRDYDDAHTLTLAAQPDADFAAAASAVPVLTLRAEVGGGEPVVLTLTF